LARLDLPCQAARLVAIQGPQQIGESRGQITGDRVVASGCGAPGRLRSENHRHFHCARDGAEQHDCAAHTHAGRIGPGPANEAGSMWFSRRVYGTVTFKTLAV
jgi:hypothetical protein